MKSGESTTKYEEPFSEFFDTPMGQFSLNSEEPLEGFASLAIMNVQVRLWRKIDASTHRRLFHQKEQESKHI
ncbi:hypothetical protein L3Y34_014253 [Caenorhabditis briggsae]|uniref:Uncharacterized protein n=1 Tax=Caenorhabditis briggsae TaxID=6238 RepID=A0AAE9IX42_CAEBR|nr:hypothetical protein L3Y34_014253 [Caenorhabditis briggsae]